MVFLKKSLLVLSLVFPALLILRVLYVDWQYEHQPIEISDLAEGGFVEQGVYGHGDLRIDGGALSWVIYDEPAEGGLSRKSCTIGIMPDPAVDVDFVFHGEDWYKLRSGTGLLREDAFTSDPEFHIWKGLLKSRVAFPINRPDFAYRLKILRDKISGRGTSPRQYIAALKRNNPSCHNIPAP